MFFSALWRMFLGFLIILESTLLNWRTLADHFDVLIKSLAVLVPEILLFVT